MNSVKTPIWTMMDMAKAEVAGFVMNIMENNRIPADAMIYVLESVQSDLKDLKANQMAERMNELNEQILKAEVKKQEGDS